MATPGTSAKPPCLRFAELNALFLRAAQLGGKAGAESQGLPRAPSIPFPVYSEESGCRELQGSFCASGSPVLAFIRITENSFKHRLPGPQPPEGCQARSGSGVRPRDLLKGALLAEICAAASPLPSPSPPPPYPLLPLPLPTCFACLLSSLF